MIKMREERQLMDCLRLDYNLYCSVGLWRLVIDDTVWVPTVFTKNRDRLDAS